MLPCKLCGGDSLDEHHSSDAAPCFQLLFGHHRGQRKQRGKAGFLFVEPDSWYLNTLMNCSVATGFRVAADMQLVLTTEMQAEKREWRALDCDGVAPLFQEPGKHQLSNSHHFSGDRAFVCMITSGTSCDSSRFSPSHEFPPPCYPSCRRRPGPDGTI